MLHRDRLESILDVFSRRELALGVEYKASDVSDRIRSRIILLYRDVVSSEVLEAWDEYATQICEEAKWLKSPICCFLFC